MSVERIAQKALERLASQFPIVGITGPRQSGKSTLAKMTFPDKKYITFDDKNLRELAKSNPKDFLLAIPDGAIIDEAQKVPEIFDAVKYFVDNKDSAPGTFILTGSSQFKLKENMTDSLAGRAAFLKLLPFSMSELNTTTETFETPYDAMVKGCYPPLYDTKKHFLKEDWFESYLDTYLDLDVKEQINVGNVVTFRKFIQLCATYSGKIVSMDSIAKNLGISSPTVKQWLSILETSFIIHFLEPDSNNLGKSVIKTPKLYFVDSGLLCYLLRIDSVSDLILSPNKGAVVETFAISELLKSRLNRAKKANLTYFRDNNGFEIDTIADWKHTFAMEIKSSSDAEPKLSSNVRKYTELRNDIQCKGSVLYLGDLTCTINNVNYVGWKDWGTFFNEL
ncbi:MAG: ATP-binding protein [Salinivirgaceae bacterium]|nr:ATP-binding protein [Salinivirgaceae bacterium]